MAEKWWQRSVVYQIYPRSFQDSNGDGIGDLPGITSRLEYIRELGADAIWLSPVYRSPNDDNGYDISDYQDIMAEFGTMADFDRMLEKAHSLGLKIVMDLVVNHSSDEHKWFVESRSSRDNPYRDYYIWREGKDGGTPNNWGSCFGGSAWQYDEKTDMYFLHLFSKKQPDLNWDNPVVRDEIFRMMDWWLQKGIDGFRMDVISLISKPAGLPDGEPGPNGYASFQLCANGPHEHEYLRELNRRVLSKYDLLTVGECAGVTLEEAKSYANLDGSELSMVFQFEHMDADFDPVLGRYAPQHKNLPLLKEILSRWQRELEGIAWNSLYWDNHDQPRVVSRYGSEKPEYRELSAKMLATCLHMMQGTPYVYQGEEDQRHRVSRQLPGLSRKGPHDGGRGHRDDAPPQPRQRPHPHAVGRRARGRLHHRKALAAGEPEPHVHQRRRAGKAPRFRFPLLSEAYRPAKRAGRDRLRPL